MSKTFRPYAPTQRLLLPPSIEDWVPEGHLARFIDEVVEDRQMSIDARRRRWSAIRYAPNVGVGQGGGRDGHLVSQRPAWRTPRRLRRPTIRSTRSPICGASPWGFGRPVQATDHGELFVGADCQSRGCVSKRVRRTT